MQVILQENVANVGKVGQQVRVKAGFGRNFLIPQGKAVIATPASIAEFEVRRVEFEKIAADVLAAAQQKATKLEAMALTIAAQSGDEGKLFGSVGPRDVAEAITAAGVEVNKSIVSLPEGPIRQTGDYEVSVKIHSDVMATVKVTITALAE